MLYNKGNAGNKSSSAYGHDDRIDILKLVKYLKTDSSLTRNNVIVIKGVNEGIAHFIAELERMLICIVIDSVYHNHVSSIALGSLNLGYGSTVREANGRLYAVLCGSQSNALCMVSRRAGYNAACLFFICELRDHISCSTNLKRARDLKIFGL